MDLKFEVSARINKPVEEVFEAVVNPENLSQFFTTGGAKGRIAKGSTVMWSFHDCPGEFPVEVDEVQPNRLITMRWDAYEPGPGTPDYKTTFKMAFEPTEDGRTLVTISEWGWPNTASGLQGSYGNCMGWTQMLCALKAWKEHGINLREGMFQ